MSSKDYPPIRGRAWLSLLCLAFLAGVVYLPSLLRAEFLNFDDNLFFDPAANGAFAQGGLGQILHPGRTIANAYLPVSHLSLYLDWVLTGTDSLGPHLHSLLLHVLAAWVLVILGVALGLASLPAFAVGSFFLVHPALVESAAWVSSRKDLLSGLFTFLSLILVARNARSPSPGLVVGAVALGMLALYSKATAIVLPGLAVAVCLVVTEGGRRRWAPVVGLSAVALGAGIHHFLLAQGEGTLVVDDSNRLSQVPGAYLHYLRVLVWPSDLNILYPEVQTMEAFRGRFYLGGLVLLLTAGMGVLLARSRFRLSGIALLAVLVTLLPFNTAFPASSVAAADRYLYLAVPAFGFAWVGLGRWGTGLLLALCLPLVFVSSQRASHFRDSEQIWRESLAVAPDNAVARLNLSADLQRRRPGHLDERWDMLDQALKQARYPVHVLAAHEALRNLALERGFEEQAAEHAQLAVRQAEQLPAGSQADARRFLTLLDAATVFQTLRREAEAEEYFARASALSPEHPTLLVHSASRLLFEAGDEEGRVDSGDPRWQQAEGMIARALAQDPVHQEAYVVRGRWQQALGEYLAAMADYERAIAAAPDLSLGYLALADLYLAQDMPSNERSGAEGAVRRGLARGLRDPALQQRLAIALMRQGDVAYARRLLEDYVTLRPRDVASARILGNLLLNQALAGLSQLPAEELERLTARAEELDPDNPRLDVVRGRIALKLRRWTDALEHLEKAHLALPEDLDVQRMLAETHRDRGYELRGFRTAGVAPEPGDIAQQKAAAMDHFRRSVDLAPAELPTEVMVSYLEQECIRLAKLGAQSFNVDDPASADLDAAESAFRRCLFLLPDNIQYQCQLGHVLSLKGGVALEEAERLFSGAVDAQRRDRLDPSMPLLFQMEALKLLGRPGEAVQLGRDFLENPGDANPEWVEQIRRAIGG